MAALNTPSKRQIVVRKPIRVPTQPKEEEETHVFLDQHVQSSTPTGSATTTATIIALLPAPSTSTSLVPAPAEPGYTPTTEDPKPGRETKNQPIVMPAVPRSLLLDPTSTHVEPTTDDEMVAIKIQSKSSLRTNKSSKPKEECGSSTSGRM